MQMHLLNFVLSAYCGPDTGSKPFLSFGCTSQLPGHGSCADLTPELLHPAAWGERASLCFLKAARVMLVVTRCPVLSGGPEKAAGPRGGTGHQPPHPAAHCGRAAGEEGEHRQQRVPDDRERQLRAAAAAAAAAAPAARGRPRQCNSR